jgi:hypothetical protein
MTPRRRTIGWLTATALVFVVGADTAPAQDEEPAVETLKERLGSKASDRQRVNDCKVPPDKRGDSTRPSDCSHIKRGSPETAEPADTSE